MVKTCTCLYWKNIYTNFSHSPVDSLLPIVLFYHSKINLLDKNLLHTIKLFDYHGPGCSKQSRSRLYLFAVLCICSFKN